MMRDSAVRSEPERNPRCRVPGTLGGASQIVRRCALIVAFAIGGCGGREATTNAPVASAGALASGTAEVRPSDSSEPSASASFDPSQVPPGLIAYMRVDNDKVERYFTVDSLGADEHALFETQSCACIGWSADGTQIWTVTETETGLRYTTMDPDGSNRVMYTPDIPTLSLAPGFGSRDGRHVVFFGWDETDPARQGIWVANTDLTDLHQVTPVPEGVVGIDPIGMSADGSQVYFHGDLGPNSDNDFHHAGNVYVIDADGTGLRQLNPEDTKTEITGTGLSANGGALAFTAWQAGSGEKGNALFVVGPDGKAERVTEWTPGLWGAVWAPTGEWIATTQSFGSSPVPSLIRPDGTDLRAISTGGRSDSAFGPVWAGDGAHFLVRRGEFHRNDLWIMDLDGQFVWQVTHKPGSHDVYAWQPGSDR